MEKKDVRVLKDLIHEKLIVEETKFWREEDWKKRRKRNRQRKSWGEREIHTKIESEPLIIINLFWHRL